MSRRAVIAIDGPAASGKSTTAREVAGRLGFVHVNSGLFYRAITWAGLARGWADEAALLAGLERLEIEPVVGSGRLDVRVMGQNPGAELQGREVSARVSTVSAQPVVRALVLRLLRSTAERADVVCDGRDIGSVVFPGASLKVFLRADVRERARRRLLEYGDDPSEKAIDAEAERLRARDHADSTRAVAPLLRATDAVEIDTTDRSPEAVVNEIVDLAEARGIRGRSG